MDVQRDAGGDAGGECAVFVAGGALAAPAVLRLEDKYKAKSFIDTFVYRAGDQVGAWSYTLLGWIGLGLTGISFVALPLAAAWCALSVWLGWKQKVLNRDHATTR